MPKLKPGTILPTHDEATAINAGIAADRDNPELTKEWFDKAKPAGEVFPPETYAALVAMNRPRGRPKADETKVLHPIRLDADQWTIWLRGCIQMDHLLTPFWKEINE